MNALVLALTLLSAPGPAEAPTWAYSLEVQASAVRVTATFPPGSGRGLQLGGGAEVQGPTLSAVDCRAGCTVTYRILLHSPRLRGADIKAYGALFTARPRALLARPKQLPKDHRLNLTWKTAPGLSLATGFATRPFAWRGRASQLPHLPLMAFGRVTKARLLVGGQPVTVAFEPGRFAASPGALTAWVRKHAEAVARYYGRFPVPHTLVVLIPTDGDRVTFGLVHGSGGATLRMFVGTQAKAADLDLDWKIRHELSHLGLPNLSRRHRWLEEGLATYVETLLAVQTKACSEETFWRHLRQGFVRGQPEGRGFEGTSDWGEIYWGGALFWFLADLEIRKNSQGRLQLDDVLKATVKSGGTMATHWPVERWLKVADAALPKAVLGPLYEQFAKRGTPVDLDAMWARLARRGRDAHLRASFVETLEPVINPDPAPHPR